MNWLREISSVEYTYIAVFVLFYAAYMLRMFIISKKLKLSKTGLATKFFLRSSYFTLFILALLGPSFGDIKKEIKAIGKDIYIAIDISESMNANDISPSRIEKIKYELTSVLDNFYSDKIGLITFAEEAFLYCPLTSDINVVNTLLGTLNTSLAINKGTNLNAPLRLALEKFSTQEGDYPRIILLVTDGENFDELNTELIDRIKKENIKLFILGIGSEKGGNIPLENKLFKTDVEGKLVLTALNKPYLKEIADLADGTYYEITPENNDMKSAVAAILKEEGAVKSSKKIDSVANKYFYFLFIAIVLVIIDVLLTVRTTKL